MSRGKIGYDFCPLPRKRGPAWRALKHVLGNCIPEKFWLLNDGKPVQVHGDDWRVSICRDLAIEARHRKHWCDALREAERAGLLTCVDGLVSIHIEVPSPAPHQHLTGTSVEVHPHLTQGSPEVQSSFTPTSVRVSNGNHSESVSQTEETDKTEETYIQTRAPARESGGGGVIAIEPARKLEIEGYKWLESVLGTTPPDLGSWRREYALIAAKPAAERAAVGRHAMATNYIQAKRSKAHPGHLVKYWDDFVAGPRSFEFDRPATAKRFAGPSRVATAEEYAADAAGGNPWD